MLLPGDLQDRPTRARRFPRTTGGASFQHVDRLFELPHLSVVLSII